MDAGALLVIAGSRRAAHDRTPWIRRGLAAALEQAGARSRLVGTAWGLVHAFELGRPQASPPIVWLHGVGGDSEGMALLATCVADERRCIVLDLPTLAPRSRRRGSVAVAGPRAVAQVVLEALAPLDAEDADLVGVSLGAWIALWVAALRPAPARTFLVSPCGLRIQAPHLESLRRGARGRHVDGLARRMLGTSAAWLRAPARAWIERVLADEEARAFLDAVADEDFVDDALGSVRGPVFVLAPETDEVLGPDGPRELLRRLPDARGATVQGAHHGVPYESPLSLVRSLRRFLDLQRLDPGPAERAWAALRGGGARLAPLVVGDVFEGRR